MNSKFYKLVIFNTFIFGILTFGYFYGVLQTFFINDASHITFVIAVMLLYNIIISLYEAWGWQKSWITSWLNHTRDHYFGYLGLGGTIWGFILVVKSLIEAVKDTQGHSDALMNVMNHLATGLSTSFSATFVGLVAVVWTSQLLYFLEEK